MCVHAIRTIDLFCGAGGSSCGAEQAGAEIVAGFDMWSVAGSTYRSNFRNALFYEEKLELLKPEHLTSDLGNVDLILASPECTNHSPAKGNAQRSEASKETAFQVVKFARTFSPRWLVIENVVNMRKWNRYAEFLGSLRSLGYNIHEHILSSNNFGVPQRRRRLFITCDIIRPPPVVIPVAKDIRTAFSVINMNGCYRYSPLHVKRRAKATLARAERAIAALGENKPFLLVYYGSDHAGGWQRLDVPLRTITTVDRFALVRPMGGDYEMRMLQPLELRAAMGMPTSLLLEHGTRRDKIKLIGNAVCPPVMKSVVSALTKDSIN